LELSNAVTVNGLYSALAIDQKGGMGGSTLSVDGKLTNNNGNVLVGSVGNTTASTLNLNAGFANKAVNTEVDSNTGGQVGNGIFSAYNATTQVTGNFFNGSFGTVAGGALGGNANAEVDLDGGSTTTVSG